MAGIDLCFGLLVAVHDHSVQERAWLALLMAFRFRLLDFATQIGGGLMILTFLARIVLVKVLSWVWCQQSLQKRLDGWASFSRTSSVRRGRCLTEVFRRIEGGS